jgi:hypothetical protein
MFYKLVFLLGFVFICGTVHENLVVAMAEKIEKLDKIQQDLCVENNCAVRIQSLVIE